MTTALAERCHTVEMIRDNVVAALRKACATLDVINDVDVMRGYERDESPSAIDCGPPLVVVRPRNTDEVARTVRVAHELGIPLIARGAGTGLAGAANSQPGCVVLSLERMSLVGAVDVDEQLITVQPGVITADVRRAARPHGLWYAPDPSSHEISTIGGNIATNAGGLCCLKYGTTRESVVSVEVVLADGSIVELGPLTKKGVVGYDLVGLIVGSEGTLGIVTSATLRLRPLPAAPSTLVATFPTLDALDVGLDALRSCGGVPALFEVMDGATIRAIEDFRPMGFDRALEGAMFLQFDDPSPEREALVGAAKAALERSASAVCFSTDDEDEGEMLLEARRAAWPALERQNDVILDDICVPVSQVGSMLMVIDEIAAAHRVEIATFGHAGDGNLHPTLLPESSDEGRQRAWEAFDAIVDAARTLGGTSAGEHGVGSLKLEHARRELGPTVVEIHRRIKDAFDPRGILNPGRGW
mgnify:CR=1 FL=1